MEQRIGFLTLDRHRTDDMPADNVLDVRSLEAPGGQDEEIDVLFAPGGSGTSSGVRVTASTALTYASVWRAVNLIATDVAKMPLETFRRLPDDQGKERDVAHPAWRLLREQSTPSLSALQLKMYLQASTLLTGNGYALITRNLAGSPSRLDPLDPGRVMPIRERRGSRSRTVYKVSPENGVGPEVILEPSSILHIRGMTTFDSDGFAGISVISKARESLGLGMAAQKYSSVFFKNSARPNLVLEYADVLDANERKNLVKSFERFYGGTDNAHRTAVLESGITAKPLGFSAEDSQLLDTRKFEIREVANWFGIPAFKLQDDARTSYNSLEIDQLGYLTEALDGWLCIWEDECRLKLLTDRQKSARSHTIEFNRNAIARADLNSRMQSYATGIQHGILTPNEARHRENLNSMPGGDQLLINGGFQPLDGGRTESSSQGQPPSDSAPAEEDSPAAASEANEGDRALRVDRIEHVAKLLYAKARKAATRESNFIDWLEGELEEWMPEIERRLAPVIQATGEQYLAEKMLHTVHEDCLRASEVPPRFLVESIEREASTFCGRRFLEVD